MKNIKNVLVFLLFMASNMCFANIQQDIIIHGILYFIFYFLIALIPYIFIAIMTKVFGIFGFIFSLMFIFFLILTLSM